MSVAVSRYLTGTHEDGHRGESKFDSSSVPEAPIRPLFYPGVLRQQAGASLRARAYPLDLPYGSPEATSTMHLTDNCHSLYVDTSTRASVVLAPRTEVTLQPGTRDPGGSRHQIRFGGPLGRAMGIFLPVATPSRSSL